MDFQQQDSQEFLRFLLDGMSEDLCRKHSEQEALTSPPEHNDKADAKGLTSPTILPMLPHSAGNSPTTGNANAVMDFSRTAPAGSVEFTPAHAHGQGQGHTQQEHRGASQRLRDETHRMRLSSESAAELSNKGHPKTASGDATSTQFPKLKNNNQGEEETSAGRVAGSNSKYVTRLRQRSEQGFEGQDRLSPLPTSTSAVMPFSPGGASVISSAEKGRLNAVIRNADEGEDASFEEPEARSKSSDFAEHEQDTPSRRLRRPARPRREGDAAAELSASVSQSLTLSGVDPQLWARITSAEKEARVAWGKYLKLNDSVITDIFAGQLQSTIECSTCHHRLYTISGSLQAQLFPFGSIRAFDYYMYLVL